MSFQNLPTQLAALFLGWLFTIYLQYLANRRTEALKRKDKIIDRLDDLTGWVESEVSKTPFNASYAEEAYSGLLLHLELRVNQFNAHVGRRAISTDKIGLLRSVDFFNAAGLPRVAYDVRGISSEFIEHIELECDAIYFSKSLRNRIGGFLAELYGVIVGLVALLVFLLFARAVVWAFF